MARFAALLVLVAVALIAATATFAQDAGECRATDLEAGGCNWNREIRNCNLNKLTSTCSCDLAYADVPNPVSRDGHVNCGCKAGDNGDCVCHQNPNNGDNTSPGHDAWCSDDSACEMGCDHDSSNCECSKYGPLRSSVHEWGHG